MTVETNSEARLDRVLAVLCGIDPALEVLDETRSPMSDLAQAAALAGQHPVAATKPDDPERRAALGLD